MVTGKITVINRTGIHLRLANKIVNAASQFEAAVMLEKDGLEVNAKSMLGVAMLGAEQGAELTLNIEGSDEREALDTLIGLFETNFGSEVI
ncbi:MAG: HPr family phosphocarrier protein [Candidatus Krumholzibacteria bacterium]|nr:HPr family phosphocarrier protein [Candidatus Krumholzibacteria bacterium]